MTTEQLNDDLLTSEEIFKKYEHLAETTLIKMYANPRKFAESIHLEYEDLLQFCLIGLWEGSESYPSSDKTSKLRSYLIRNIRWSLGRHIDRSTVMDRFHKSKKHSEENLVSLISMSHTPHQNDEDKTTYYDVVATDNIFNFNSEEVYPENIVVSKFNVNKLMSILTEEEQEIVKLRIGNDELTFKEIGELKGKTKQAIHMRFKKIQSKINEYLQKEAVAY